MYHDADVAALAIRGGPCLPDTRHDERGYGKRMKETLGLHCTAELVRYPLDRHLTLD